jgi:hypothetical protein
MSMGGVTNRKRFVSVRGELQFPPIFAIMWRLFGGFLLHINSQTLSNIGNFPIISNIGNFLNEHGG